TRPGRGAQARLRGEIPAARRTGASAPPPGNRRNRPGPTRARWRGRTRLPAGGAPLAQPVRMRGPAPSRQASALLYPARRRAGGSATAVQRARRGAIQAVRAPLWVLGTLGAVMPFVGLFGTVVGILGSFRQIGLAGQSGFAVVAPAISEALIAPAGGIAVAVE